LRESLLRCLDLDRDRNYLEPGTWSCSEADARDRGRTERRTCGAADERTRADRGRPFKLFRPENVFSNSKGRIKSIKYNGLNNVANERKETHELATWRTHHLGFSPIDEILFPEGRFWGVIFCPLNQIIGLIPGLRSLCTSPNLDFTCDPTLKVVQTVFKLYYMSSLTPFVDHRQA